MKMRARYCEPLHKLFSALPRKEKENEITSTYVFIFLFRASARKDPNGQSMTSTMPASSEDKDVDE